MEVVNLVTLYIYIYILSVLVHLENWTFRTRMNKSNVPNLPLLYGTTCLLIVDVFKPLFFLFPHFFIYYKTRRIRHRRRAVRPARAQGSVQWARCSLLFERGRRCLGLPTREFRRALRSQTREYSGEGGPSRRGWWSSSVLVSVGWRTEGEAGESTHVFMA